MVQQSAAPAVPTTIAEDRQVTVPQVAATQVIAECRRQQIAGVTTANMSSLTAIATPVAVAASESVSDGNASLAVAADDRKAEGYVDSRVTRIATRTWSPTATIAAPMAVAGLDTTGDGRANLVVAGEDRNRDGIPDVLQATATSVGTSQVSTTVNATGGSGKWIV